jgi:hypothetical protein
MRAVRENGGLLILDGDSPVLFYRSHSLDPAREPWRAHSIHPLYAPDGTVLTEDAPADHIHHRGCFWAWRRILQHGHAVADSWVMHNLAFEPRSLQLEHEGKFCVMRTAVDWRLADTSALVASEETSVRIHPLTAKRERRIDFEIEIKARQSGLAIAGSDDDKGYGGFSLRLVRSDTLIFTTGDRRIEPMHGPVNTDGSITFAWSGDGPTSVVTATCTANGVLQRDWALRRRASMQNCVFPGRAPFPIPERLHLSARVVIAPGL